MSSWILVDLQDFSDKTAPVFEKLSVFTTSYNDQDFLEREKSENAEIILINGNKDIKYLEKSLTGVSENDHCYLVTNTLNLSAEAEGELNRFLLNTNKIKGVIESNQGLGFIVSQLSGIKEVADLTFEVDSDREYFEEFDEQLSKLSAHLSKQLEKVKEVHRNVVPQRSIKFGRYHVTSKYAAGESSISEFWDAVKTNNSLVLFLLSTNNSSHLTKVLDVCLAFLNQKSFEKRDIKIVYEKLQDKLGEDFSLTILLSQINEEKTYLILKGSQILYLNGKEVVSTQDGKLSKLVMKKNDKLNIISRGLMLNYEEDFRLPELEKMLKKNWRQPQPDYYNDLFFKAKNNHESKFQQHDCCAIMIEVTE